MCANLVKSFHALQAINEQTVRCQVNQWSGLWSLYPRPRGFCDRLEWFISPLLINLIKTRNVETNMCQIPIYQIELYRKVMKIRRISYGLLNDTR
jgi:hypothetical protein